MRRRDRIHSPSIIARLREHLRGRSQRLVRTRGDAPYLLISYPRGQDAIAETLETLYTHQLPSLSEAVAGPYRRMFASLPPMVVVLLRPNNPCTCLGHHHPAGTESRLARRLKTDTGGAVGEIDIAYEGIRNWQPHPLSSLAAGDVNGRLPDLHFQAALLAVMLHELEHLAHPEHSEREVRTASNDFYSAVMEEFVRQETGAHYGMG